MDQAGCPVSKPSCRPILFSGAMVKAILEGRKTQTRRIVIPRQSKPKVAPLTMYPWLIDGELQTFEDGRPLWVGDHPDYPYKSKWFACDYGQPGDVLWVRETWKPIDGRILYYATPGIEGHDQRAQLTLTSTGKADGWRPSIFMPRWASRLTLEITDVRVERLQAITGPNIRAEGVIVDGGSLAPIEHWLAAFSKLWDGINAKRAPWASNPWVWVIEFKLLSTTPPARSELTPTEWQRLYQNQWPTPAAR